jgi:hypothetical protein
MRKLFLNLDENLNVEEFYSQNFIQISLEMLEKFQMIFVELIVLVQLWCNNF